MSDFELVARAVDRIGFACRARRVDDPGAPPEAAPDGGGVNAPPAPARVSAHQAGILSHLDAVDPTMVGELAEHLGVTASTMSLTLKRLEESGLVRRDRDPADRRVVNVRLTEAGQRVRDANTALDAERVERLLSFLSPLERREALHGLALLVDAADALVRRGREDVEAQVGGGTV